MTPPKLQAITIRGKTLHEIVENRNYTRKMFLGPRFPAIARSRRYHFHTAHIHYRDPGGAFLPINTTLSWKATTRTYEQSAASYHCTIPEYANGWFEFFNGYEGTNHTIRARPVCSHIKGTLLEDLHDGLGRYHGSVLYKDSFGPGVDLRVVACWSGLRKVIVINKKPADISSDLHFDFELDIPADLQILDKQGTPWDRKVNLNFKGNTLRVGKDGKYSLFKNARIWDSAKLRVPVDISLYFSPADNKLFLRKTIKKSLLAAATYPLYTDHPTNYPVGSGDGYCSVDSAVLTYQEVHDAATGIGEHTAVFSAARNEKLYGFMWSIFRWFCPINTAGIDDDAEIQSASLNVYIYYITNADSDTITIVQTTQASVESLEGNDYDNVGTEAGGSKAIVDIIDDQINAIDLDDTGIAWINKTGWTKIGLRTQHDIDAAEPSGPTGVTGQTSEYEGEDRDPYLDVTTGPAPGNPYPTSLLRKDVIHGYNCFMQAYVNAKRAGLDPLKLPDGTTF